MTKQIITNNSCFKMYSESERQAILGKNYIQDLMPKKQLQFNIINIGRKYITVEYKVEEQKQTAKIEKSDLLHYISDITLNKTYNTSRKIVYNFIF